MPKTNFQNGTIVTPDFLDTIFQTNGGHDHRGEDRDGSAPKLDINEETIGEIDTSRLTDELALALLTGLPGIGDLKPNAGTGTQLGWLNCNGLEVPSGTEFDLFRQWIDTNAPHLKVNGAYYTPFMAGKSAIGEGTIYENGETYNFVLGESGGEVQHTLTINEMPAHHHSADQGRWAKADGNNSDALYSDGDQQTGDTGGGQSHNNMPPYFVVNWLIKAF